MVISLHETQTEANQYGKRLIGDIHFDAAHVLGPSTFTSASRTVTLRSGQTNDSQPVDRLAIPTFSVL